MQDDSNIVPLTPNETHMFKAMTESLKIPHFGYTHVVDLTDLNALRLEINDQLQRTPNKDAHGVSKLTPLAIILKCISQTFEQHPRLNALLDADPNKPSLVMQESHNFGVAVDTPRGLLVPVLRDVQRHSVFSIAAELRRLTILAKEGRLAPADMAGATFTVSNIGSIGGAAVSPIILSPMTAIVAIGKIEEVAAFARGSDGEERVVKRQKVVLSWSADHRVHDGAAVGRCAEALRAKLESADRLGIGLE